MNDVSAESFDARARGQSGGGVDAVEGGNAAPSPDDTRRAPFLRLKALAALPLAALLVGGGYGLFIDSLAESGLREALLLSLGEDAKIEIGELNTSLLGPKLRIRNLVCSRAAADLPAETERGQWREALAFDEFNADVEFWPLLAGRVWVKDFTLKSLRVDPDAWPKKSGSAEARDRARRSRLDLPKVRLEAVNDLLNDLDRFLNDPWVQKGAEWGQDWLDARARKKDEAARVQKPDGPARPASPPYILRALATAGKPGFVLRRGEVSGLNIGGADTTRRVSGVENFAFIAENVTSHPTAWPEDMTFQGSGNLTGRAAGPAELKLAFDHRSADGRAKFRARLAAPGLFRLFGEGVKDAKSTLSVVSETRMRHLDLSLNGVLAESDSLTGLKIHIPGGEQAHSQAFALVDVVAENFPLDRIAERLGDLPFDLEPGLRGIISTRALADNHGEGIAISASGVAMNVAIDARGLRIKAKPGKKVLGVPGPQFAVAFNLLMESLEKRDKSLHFHFQVAAAKDSQRFKLVSPREDELIDAMSTQLEAAASRLLKEQFSAYTAEVEARVRGEADKALDDLSRRLMPTINEKAGDVLGVFLKKEEIDPLEGAAIKDAAQKAEDAANAAQKKAEEEARKKAEEAAKDALDKLRPKNPFDKKK